MNMEYKQLGKTGEKVFVIGLGTYGHGDAYGGIGKNDSYEIFSSIANNLSDSAKFLIDSAPHYGSGRVEEWFGQFIKGLGKEKILVATKGGRRIEPNRYNEKDFSADFLRDDLNGSLRRLGVNEIFLYQLHNPDLEVLREGRVFDLLEEFRDAGKITYYGVSINEPEEGIISIKVCNQKGYDGLASIQVIYNILNKSADKELFNIAGQSNIAIIAREPLFRGFLTDKYGNGRRLLDIPPARKKTIDIYGWEQIQSKIQEARQILQKYEIEEPLSKVAIKFVLSCPYVTLTIPGTNRQEYIEPNLSAASMILDDEVLSELNGVVDITSPYESVELTKDQPTRIKKSNRHTIGMFS